MGRVERQGLLIRLHGHARALEILLGDLAQAKLNSAAAGSSLGSLSWRTMILLILPVLVARYRRSSARSACTSSLAVFRMSL